MNYMKLRMGMLCSLLIATAMAQAHGQMSTGFLGGGQAFESNEQRGNMARGSETGPERQQGWRPFTREDRTEWDEGNWRSPRREWRGRSVPRQDFNDWNNWDSWHDRDATDWRGASTWPGNPYNYGGDYFTDDFYNRNRSRIRAGNQFGWRSRPGFGHWGGTWNANSGIFAGPGSSAFDRDAGF